MYYLSITIYIYIYILTCSISHGPCEPTVDHLNMNKIRIWIWMDERSIYWEVIEKKVRTNMWFWTVTEIWLF